MGRRAWLLSAAVGAVAGRSPLRQAVSAPAGAQPRVAVLRDAFPGADWGAADAVVARLRGEGLVVAVLDGVQVSDPAILSRKRYVALVLPDARWYPAEGMAALHGFLRPVGGGGGGHLLALGGPTLQHLLLRQAGRWLTRSEALSPAAFGQAPMDLQLIKALVSPQSAPRMTGLVPLPPGDADEAFLISGPVRLEESPGQVWVSGLPPLSGVQGAVTPVFRPRGLGNPLTGEGGSQLPYRFLPLVLARGADGALRGVPGAAVLHSTGSAAGGVWATLGLPPARLGPEADYAAAFMAQVLHRAIAGVFLMAGGGPATVSAGASLVLGASVAGVDAGGMRLSISFALDGRTVATAPLPMAVSVETTAPTAGEHEVSVQLRHGPDLLDQITAPLRTLPAQPTRRQAPVTVVGGEFVAGGRPWRPVGINYWPRSTSGLRTTLFWPSVSASGWLLPLLYDPDVVEADLTAMAQLGFNLVSGIQYYQSEQAPALRDFLARCDAHGIRANISVSGANPLAPDVSALTALIEAANIQQDGAIFAYDLAWEPTLGDQAARARYAPAWQAWVQDQYGGFTRAATAWGSAGGEDGPTDSQLTQDGPWRAMVAAYRRFVDDLITAGYAHVWRAIRDTGDRHLLGARTGYGGTGQMAVVPRMPFDLASGTLLLDFVSPEGYGLGPSWAATAPGGFITAYGRAVAAGHPVYWAEWGLSIWSSPVTLQASQAELYQSMYRMIAASRANGGCGWWFPGGYRVDERSDFGVFNPDGTPRPAAQAIRAAVHTLAAQGPLPEPDVWLEVDRDRWVQGVAGALAELGPQYAAALAAGQLPGVRLPGTGTDSLNCPLVAVGARAYPGYGPVQALNAAFVRVRVASGAEVADGGSVPPGATLEVKVGNTAPAAWVDNVRLVVEQAGGPVQHLPLQSTGPVPFLGMAATAPVHLSGAKGPVRLQMEAVGRTRFGPVLHLMA